jgi:unconventional prefoldin RPB5 interactor 1
MAIPVKDSFIDLERHRVRLEENVAKLQKALQHWQTWDAEYEGLKEEILAYNGDPKAEDIVCTPSWGSIQDIY